MLQWIIAVVLPILLGLVGLILLFRELLRRTGSDGPFCRKCGYNVTGLPTTVCPECGVDFATVGVSVGRRTPRRGRLAVAASLIASALALSTLLLSPSFRSLQINDLLPMWVFLDRFETGVESAQAAAWGQIQRRIQAGRVTDEDVRRLVAVSIDRLARAATTESSAGGRVRLDKSGICAKAALTALSTSNRLTPADADRLAKLLIEKVTLELRPVIRVGDKGPVRIMSRLTPLGTSLLPSATELRCEKIIAAGAAFSDDLVVFLSTEHLEKSEISGVVVFNEPGVQEVTATLTPLRTTLSILGPLQLIASTRVDVRAADSEDDIELVSSPAIDAEVARVLHFVSVHLGKSGYGWHLQNFEGLPLVCSFDLYVRLDGRDHYIASDLVMPDGQEFWPEGPLSETPTEYQQPPIGDRRKVTLVLKPDRDLARKTPGVTQIWGGELIIEDVPIQGR